MGKRGKPFETGTVGRLVSSCCVVGTALGLP